MWKAAHGTATSWITIRAKVEGLTAAKVENSDRCKVENRIAAKLIAVIVAMVGAARNFTTFAEICFHVIPGLTGNLYRGTKCRFPTVILRNEVT